MSNINGPPLTLDERIDSLRDESIDETGRMAANLDDNVPLLENEEPLEPKKDLPAPTAALLSAVQNLEVIHYLSFTYINPHL